jgi:hypothetical protein
MEFSAISFELRSILDLFRKSNPLSDFYPCYLCSLFQGSMTVTEYRDRFLQLARYAPADVVRDSDKQEYSRRDWMITSSMRC